MGCAKEKHKKVIVKKMEFACKGESDDGLIYSPLTTYLYPQDLNVGWVHGFIGISLLSDEIGNCQIVGFYMIIKTMNPSYSLK
jgi:hypothetical protein